MNCLQIVQARQVTELRWNWPGQIIALQIPEKFTKPQADHHMQVESESQMDL